MEIDYNKHNYNNSCIEPTNERGRGKKGINMHTRILNGTTKMKGLKVF